MSRVGEGLPVESCWPRGSYMNLTKMTWDRRHYLVKEHAEPRATVGRLFVASEVYIRGEELYLLRGFPAVATGVFPDTAARKICRRRGEESGGMPLSWL